LWSFDGDFFDRYSGKLAVEIDEPYELLDEIDNQNPALIISSNSGVSDYEGYSLGRPSLVELEPADQYSICFAYYGYLGFWPKTFLQISHTSTYRIP
jgi:hypothetical protein